MPSELAFRAQLVVDHQRRLYDYWRSCAGTRAMPAKRSIDPVAIPDLLPGISLLETGSCLDDMTYRLAGTRLREIYGLEVTGRRVFDLDMDDKRNYWQAAYRKVVEEKLPMQGAIKGPLVSRDHVILFWLRLPLSDDGVRVDRILCYDISMPASLSQDETPSASQQGS